VAPREIGSLPSPLNSSLLVFSPTVVTLIGAYGSLSFVRSRPFPDIVRAVCRQVGLSFFIFFFPFPRVFTITYASFLSCWFTCCGHLDLFFLIRFLRSRCGKVFRRSLPLFLYLSFSPQMGLAFLRNDETQRRNLCSMVVPFFPFFFLSFPLPNLQRNFSGDRSVPPLHGQGIFPVLCTLSLTAAEILSHDRKSSS